jgi:hypothetical protein
LNKKQPFSYQPEVYFGHDWHHSGNRFASEKEAETFVANLRATWNPQGFVKRDRIHVVKVPPNVSLDWKTKQAQPLVRLDKTDDNDGRAA